MRHLSRISLAAMIFAATAVGVYAQDPNPQDAPPAPVVTAVPDTPAAEPAPTDQQAPADQPAAAPENAPSEPAPAPVVEQPAAPVQAPPAVAAPVAPSKEKVTEKKSTRVTQSKEKAKLQETAPVVEKPQAVDPAAAAAGTAASGASSNPPPPEGPAPPPAVENPAPPPPPMEAGDIVQQKEQVETKTNEGGNGWIVVGIVAIAGVGIYLLMSRRRKEESLTIYDRDIPTERFVEHSISGTVRTQPRTGPPIQQR